MLTDKTSNIKSNFVYHLRNTAMPIHFRLTFYAQSSQHCSIFALTFFSFSGQHAAFRRSKSATQNIGPIFVGSYDMLHRRGIRKRKCFEINRPLSIYYKHFRSDPRRR